jgi:hypothetical protein
MFPVHEQLKDRTRNPIETPHAKQIDPTLVGVSHEAVQFWVECFSPLTAVFTETPTTHLPELEGPVVAPAFATSHRGCYLSC